MAPFAPTARDPRVDDLLGEAPRAPFTEAFHRVCEFVDAYALEWAVELAHRLELPESLRHGVSVEELLAARRFQPGFRFALDWLLRRLAQAGLLAANGGGKSGHYRLLESLRASCLAELSAIAGGFEPSPAPTLRLLDAAAEIYPAVARGEVHGEQALFGAGRIALWVDYFSERNRFYAISNELAAAAVVHRLRPGAGLRLLEVGAGAGSASQVLLVELARAGRLADLELYRVTEPSAFFRRRGERTLRAAWPTAPLEFASLDLNEEAVSEPDRPFDLVFGVNVLHVARDLPAALERLTSRLAPGGWLVAGECFRLFPHQAVDVELVFLILESFIAVATDAERRPNPGFLTPEQWQRLFAEAGLGELTLVPDLIAIREFYDRFFAGALCGRKPLE